MALGAVYLMSKVYYGAVENLMTKVYLGSMGVPWDWGVPWPSRGVPWPLYEDHALEPNNYLYYYLIRHTSLNETFKKF